MKKITALKASVLMFLISITNCICAFANEAEDALPESGIERLNAIVEELGAPPRKLVVAIIILLALILISVVYYKEVLSKEEENNGEQ